MVLPDHVNYTCQLSMIQDYLIEVIAAKGGYLATTVNEVLQFVFQWTKMYVRHTGSFERPSSPSDVRWEDFPLKPGTPTRAGVSLLSSDAHLNNVLHSLCRRCSQHSPGKHYGLPRLTAIIEG